MTETPRCKTCQGQLIQKNRTILFLVGVIMLIASVALWFVPWLWIVSIPLVLAGGYLLAWSTIGKGLWCRQCKKFAS